MELPSIVWSGIQIISALSKSIYLNSTLIRLREIYSISNNEKGSLSYTISSVYGQD